MNDDALAATLKSSPPLFCSTRPEPLRPLIVPPMVNGPTGAGILPMNVSRSPPRCTGLPGRLQANEKPNTLTSSVRWAETFTVVLPTPRSAGPPLPSAKLPAGKVTVVAVSETVASNKVCTTRGDAAGFQRSSLTRPLSGAPLTPQSGAAR